METMELTSHDQQMDCKCIGGLAYLLQWRLLLLFGNVGGGSGVVLPVEHLDGGCARDGQLALVQCSRVHKMSPYSLNILSGGARSHVTTVVIPAPAPPWPVAQQT